MYNGGSISIFDLSNDFQPQFISKIKAIYNLTVDHVEKGAEFNDCLNRSSAPNTSNYEY
jgi:hypothetical protein